MVKALASHQCGPRSTPGNDAICGLSLLLVLSFAPRGFSPGTPVFLSPQKPTFPNSNSTRNQVDEEPLCGCVTCKSLFIFIYLFIYSFIYNSLLEEYITGWVMYKFRRGQNAEPYSMFPVSWRPKSCLSPGCIKTQKNKGFEEKSKGCIAKHVDLVQTNHGLGLKDIVGLLIGIKGGDTAFLFQMFMSLAGSEQYKALLELNGNAFGISTLKTPSGNTVTSFKSKADTLNRQSWQAQNK